MNISELGEFPLIKRLTENIKIYHPDETLKGVGDDAAIIAAPLVDVSASAVEATRTDVFPASMPADVPAPI
ncbi:MAG: hypothetical protein LBF01_04825, partial [Bacteroidales bacterium]|nr:hypothetical protein [Bacteroidales bacterium]